MVRAAKFLCGICATVSMLASAEATLSIVPQNPSPLDVVRARYVHTGCTNPDSVRVSQSANVITVSADAIFQVDCGTVNGFFEDFTVGRLPAGQYDLVLEVNPPPPTLGPTLLVGPIHFSIAAYPPTGSLHPHDNYEDVWWTPAESGWALSVAQSGERLFMVWNVYDANGRATWYVVPNGAWVRGDDGRLKFAGALYTTTGPAPTGTFDSSRVAATAAGTAEFVPSGAFHAQFNFTIGDVSGSKVIQRFSF